jgi:hypothetical protein
MSAIGTKAVRVGWLIHLLVGLAVALFCLAELSSRPPQPGQPTTADLEALLGQPAP